MKRIVNRYELWARNCVCALLLVVLSACSSTRSAGSEAAPAATLAPGATPTAEPTLIPAARSPTAETQVANGSHAADCSTLPAGDRSTPTGGGAAGGQDEQVQYDEQSNTITIAQGAPTTLPAISSAIAQPDALRELAPGEWLLGANLSIERGASLRISAPDVRRLKLRSDEQGFVWIKALGGALDIAGVCITSWDVGRDTFDTNYADGRSFVLAREGARLTIRDAELSYLGYAADESYGLAWRMQGTSGGIRNSRLGYNYYGLYTYEVSDLVIGGNEVHHSIQYGIDPHTRSNRLLIEGNTAHHNGKHGIILAEQCSGSVIRGNTVYANTMHGIVLYQDSNNNLVEGNTSYQNGLEGIDINNATDNTIRNNSVYGNTKSGIGVGQHARGNFVTGNQVSNNLEDGIALYSDATENTLQDNVVSDNGRYGIYDKSEDNAIADDNELYGNRADDLRRSAE
jgi:parallel beta-helix repeat protein